MSSKPTYNMDSNAEKMQSQGNLHPISEATLSSSELYLDELTHGVTGTIIVMICRSWDVHTITGRYVSTDFIMFDAKANKEEYHIFRDHAYMVELDGAASVRKTSVKGGGFVRYPFQLAELDKLYMSSGSSIQILDDPQIPALKELRAENSLRPSNAESRLMTSGHERDGTSHPVVVRNVRKELCGRMEVSGVRRVARLLNIQY
ncbi:hypothetical protein Tco_1095045 [Tanacetum coccineum]